IPRVDQYLRVALRRSENVIERPRLESILDKWRGRGADAREVVRDGSQGTTRNQQQHARSHANAEEFPTESSVPATNRRKRLPQQDHRHNAQLEDQQTNRPDGSRDIRWRL